LSIEFDRLFPNAAKNKGLDSQTLTDTKINY
jgi:hypothetical protein